MTHPALLLCALLAAQGPAPAPMAPALTFAEDAGRGVTVPVVDAQGLPVALHAPVWTSGYFDGDQDLDLAVVAGSASSAAGTLAVLSAKGHDLGRFRRLYQVTGSVSAAARHRSNRYLSPGGQRADHLVYAEPANPWLTALYWNYSVLFPGFTRATTYLQVGTGVRELASADLDHNGHDEIYLLRDDAGGTELAKYPYSTTSLYGAPVAGTPVVLRVPLRLERMLPADLDGDGQGDVIAYAPGIGLVGLVHDVAANTFRPYWVLGCARPGAVHAGHLGALVLPDAGPAPLDLAVTFANEVDVVRCQGPVLRLLHRAPAPLGSSWQAAVLTDGTGEGTPDLLVQDRALTGLTIYPALASGVGAPLRIVPGQATVPWQGSGASDDSVSLLPLDVDEDGDQDLLFLHPGQDRLVCVRNTAVSLKPTLLSVRNDGLAGPNQEYLQQTLLLTLPPELLAVTHTLELVVYRRNSQSTPARLSLPIDTLTSTGNAQLRLYYFRTRQPGDAQGLGVITHESDGTPVLNGDCFVSVHGLAAGGRRFESVTLGRSYAGGDQTAMSIRWEVSAPPPLFDIDDERLPW